MQAWSLTAWTPLALATVIVSALVTWASITYAHRRQLIDRPGQRRSHVFPTPRGGGIGIVVAVIFAICLVTAWMPSDHAIVDALALVAAILLVAVVGWIDDHRDLSARLRFAAHCVAALVLGLPALSFVSQETIHASSTLWLFAALAVCAFALVWSINLHNFMDGINGLLILQAIFVFGVLAWICVHAGRFVEAERIGLFAAAALGFLPFNFPRARIFMGDVGSGVLGLLVVVAIGWQIAAVPSAYLSGLIACSAFLVDSTATLLSRMLGGRRWYSAHREHLYQWLVRTGYSHTQVTGMYMGWNLLVVLPVLIWINRGGGASSSIGSSTSLMARDGSMALFAVYALAVLTWVFGKRYCLKAFYVVRSRSL